MIEKIFFYVIVAIIFTGCQEIYSPEGLENNDTYLVVEGLITDGPGPYTVRISQASKFSNSLSIGSNLTISNAKVYFIDNAGVKEQLVFKSMGVYQTSVNSKIVGSSGKSFKLYFELQGQKYESKFVKMKEKVSIDTIYAKVEQNKIIERTSTNDITVKTENGLMMYANYSNTQNEKFYIRTEAKALIQETYAIHFMPADFGTPVYKWTTKHYVDFPQIGTSYSYSGNENIKELKVGFKAYRPPYDYNPNASEEPDTANPAAVPGYPMNMQVYLDGWVVLLTAYTISPDAYKFYQLVNNQLSPSNSLFDPIASQIKGNIKCTSDTTLEVLGLFDVVSIAQKYMYFYLPSTITNFKTRSVPANYKFPKYSVGEDTAKMPDFWITYY